MKPPLIYLWLVLLLMTSATGYGSDRIANTKHDLSVHSPNAIRAVDEEQICIFCHVTHNAEPQTPLWNRHSPSVRYRIYHSSTTDARIDQPSGPSKMCLSCHDGTLALGLVRSRPATDPIAMTTFTMPLGSSDLTTDLSDDHPIGFRYDRALSNADHQLRDPQLISHKLELGPHNEVHCTTCHDPHDNELGDFLRMPVRQGALCISCHKMDGWSVCSHALSPRHVPSRPIDPARRLEFATLSDNSCLTCHQIHGAEGRERLLKFASAESNCVVCHDGTGASTDILSVIRLSSSHRPRSFGNHHDPGERIERIVPNHVECVDCHNPHAARSGKISPGLGNQGTITGPLLNVPGIGLQGQQVRFARQEYEVCLRCHGDRPVKTGRTISRVQPDQNLRRQISPSAASSHPLVLPRPAADVPSILPDLAGKRILCTDCHNSNNARSLGGSGPDGPHGSAFDPILGLRYETRDSTVESATVYALCYRCHSRSSILANDSFSLHRRHIVNVRTPCSACHDPHGVAGSKTTAGHLINFDRSLVTPSERGGIEFRDLGRFQGTCTLKCHGVNHVDFRYSPTTPP